MIENQKNKYQDHETWRPAWEKNRDKENAEESCVDKTDTIASEEASKLEKEERLKQIIIAPHVYPGTIKFLGYVAVIVFIAVTAHFFFYHFSYHLEFAKTQQQALEALIQRDYERAHVLYQQLLYEAPHEKSIKIQLIKTHIALAQDMGSLVDAITDLDFTLKEEEFNSIKRYVAPEFLEFFESCFESRRIRE